MAWKWGWDGKTKPIWPGGPVAVADCGFEQTARWRCHHLRQTNPICGVLGLETGVGGKNKAKLAGEVLLPKCEAGNSKSETNPKFEGLK